MAAEEAVYFLKGGVYTNDSYSPIRMINREVLDMKFTETIYKLTQERFFI